MTDLISKLTSEAKDFKQVLTKDFQLSEEEIAERFPTLNMLTMIPDGMLESPMVQAMINNLGK